MPTGLGEVTAGDRPTGRPVVSTLPKRRSVTHPAPSSSCRGFGTTGSCQLELTQPRLLVIGPNGIGKSNLLEAVELLGSLRSHRCSQDRDLIQWEAPRALLRAGLG